MKKDKPEAPPEVVEIVEDAPEPEPEVFYPQSEAHRLSLRGLPWREIAQRTGYPDAASAFAAVQRWRQAGAAQRAASEQRAAFEEQMERYGTLLDAWWDDAVTAKKPAALTGVLRILERMDKLQRLDEPQASNAPTALVIPSDPAAYLAGLKAIVDARTPPREQTGEQPVSPAGHKK